MALVGFLSDSHGEWLRTRQAIKLLLKSNCKKIIHLGDIETIEVLDELAGHKVSLVFGNCDSPSRLLDYATTLGIDVQHPAGTIKIENLKIAFLHGDDVAKYNSFLKDDSIHIVAHGHTHEMRDEIIENTRCINPGALHRAPSYTVGVLDTETNLFEFLEVSECND